MEMDIVYDWLYTGSSLDDSNPDISNWQYLHLSIAPEEVKRK